MFHAPEPHSADTAPSGSYRSYLGWGLATVLGIAAIVFSINLLVDPLWYAGGNRLGDRNFAFNERLSKINRFLQAPEQYDCLIFGSSRTTLLNENLIDGHRCFNFAFSRGAVGEFVTYAAYLKSLGVRPKLVIVGVDGFNLYDWEPTFTVPDFVRELTPPPSMLVSYLSMDSLEFSVRTLAGRSVLSRYYRPDFTADILDSAPVYAPTRPLSLLPNSERPPYSTRNVPYFVTLRDLFPQARVIGYVPPISGWEVEKILRTGSLETYLAAMPEIAQTIRPLYDFSIPSAVTAETGNTYDGSHFSPAVNRQVAATLNDGDPRFSLQVDRMTPEEYATRYRHALDSFLARHGPSSGESPGQFPLNTVDG